MNFVQSTKLYFYVRGSSCLNIYFLSSLFPEQCIQQAIPSIASHAMVWIHKKTSDTGWTLKDGMWLLTVMSLTWCTGSVGLTAMSLTRCIGSVGLTATSLTRCTGSDSRITYLVYWAWQPHHLPGVPGYVGLTAVSLTRCSKSMGLTAASLTQFTGSGSLTAVSLTRWAWMLGLWSVGCLLSSITSPSFRCRSTWTQQQDLHIHIPPFIICMVSARTNIL